MAEPKDKAPKRAPGTMGIRDAAHLLKMTPERVRQLVKDGWIPRDTKGIYPIVATVHGYIDFLRDEARRSQQNVSANRARDARAREIELRIAQAERELIPMAEAMLVLDEVVAACRYEMQTLAGRVTSDVGLRRKIEEEINASLGRISGKLGERGEALVKGGDALQADPSDDA